MPTSIVTQIQEKLINDNNTTTFVLTSVLSCKPK